MNFGSSARAAVDINLTPLIDILFLVLVFLVMTATFAQRTFVDIHLPEAASGTPAESDQNVIRIEVDAEGMVYLDGQVAGLEGVRQRLLALPDGGPMAVVLAADERTAHGQVIEVIDLVRQTSIAQVRLETLPAPIPAP